MNNFLKQIPLERALWYLLFLGVIPLLFSFWTLWDKKEQLTRINEQLAELEEFALFKKSRGALNRSVRETYANSDRFYLDNKLESIIPQKKEREILEKIAKQTNFIDNDIILNRLETLQKKNRLLFAESNVQSLPGFTETTETLLNPVEVTLEDLDLILETIENLPQKEGGPLLIVSDIRIEKKETRPGSEAFLLTLKLIKREFQ